MVPLLLALGMLTTLSGCEQSPAGPADATVPDTVTVAAADETEASSRVPVEVTGIIDGDTIEIRIDGEVELVRFIGINSPETGGPYREAECYGTEASMIAAESIASATTISLQQDQTDRDQFDRLLRYVWLETSAAEPVLLNELLVSRGAAYARAYPPDLMFQSRLDDAESAAQRRELGLWNSCA